jgi:nucleotide-binding universal stress UspA family protein
LRVRAHIAGQAQSEGDVFRSILVPLDGSRFAEMAIPVARQLARSAHARLRFVLVHEPAGTPVPASGAAPEAAGDGEVRAREGAYLADTAARLDAGDGSPDFEIRDGRPAESLEQCIAERRPDLVVMATHGRGSVDPLWLGSVADYLLRTVAVPLLLVHPRNGDAVPPAATGLRSVLAPVDLSEQSERILAPLAEFACLTQAHVTLLHVVEMGDARRPFFDRRSSEELECARREAQRQLDHLAEGLRARGIQVATRAIVASDAARAILDHLTQGHSECLAVTTHGTGGYRDRLLGAVADKVIRGAMKPVLVLRPAAA